MTRLFISLYIVFFSTFGYAESIDLAYKSFYSHVRKLQQEDTEKLQFAFGFVHIHTQKLCELNSAKIVTPKKIIPLSISTEQRFTVPSERALNLAEALVQIDFVEKANVCDMSVQLETKFDFLKQRYTQQELLELERQFAAFFNEMGSFLSFLMPSVKGLMISFEDKKLYAQITDSIRIQQGLLILEDEALSNLSTLELPQKPMRITALSSR